MNWITRLAVRLRLITKTWRLIDGKRVTGYRFGPAFGLRKPKRRNTRQRELFNG